MAVLALPFTSARSQRLVLRKAAAEDLDPYVELCSDPDVRRFLGGPVSAERLRARLEMRGVESLTEDSGAFVIAHQSTGELLGTLTLERRPAHRPGHVDEGADELELSYMLRKEWWGQGLATEASSLLLRRTALHLPDETVMVVTQVSNTPSIVLAKRLGFEFVATFCEFDAEQWLGASQLHSLGSTRQSRI